jgi:glycosyltransferase involved in cell wall biosynthesis
VSDPEPDPDPDLALVRAHLDAGFYLERYPDVRAGGLEPALHYLRQGWREGRDPGPGFSTGFYLERNPDVRAGGGNPFLHWLRAGRAEGRPGTAAAEAAGAPPPLDGFDRETVLGRLLDLGAQLAEAAPALRLALVDRLLLTLFDPGFYRRQKGLDPATADLAALARYVAEDYPDGPAPTPLFDPDFYRAEIARRGLPPAGDGLFRHWLQHGAAARVPPTALFRDADYLRLNPDLAGWSEWPFLHFVRHGIAEGRDFTPLATIARNPIARRGRGAAGRTGDFFAAAASPDARAALAGMQATLAGDRLRRLVVAAAGLEPQVGGLADAGPSLLPPWHDEAYPQFLSLLERVPPGRYDRVVLVPFCKLGGADFVAGILTRALATAPGRTLILRTEQSDWARPDWFDPGAVSVDLAWELATAAPEVRIRGLYQLIRRVGARDVFNVNSRAGFQLFARFGARMRRFAGLHAYYFCADRTADGLEAGYPVEHFADAIGSLSTAIVDNRALAAALGHRFRLPPGLAARVVVLPTPAMRPPADPEHGRPLAERQRATRAERPRPVVLWAGRFDRQKRFDLLLAIARAMPEADFRAWGAAVLDAPPDLAALPANLSLHGTFADWEELPLRSSDAWLYTAAWDGLPTVLIEVGGLGLPVVASAVGGVPDLVTPETGWPVEGDDPGAYVAALRALLADRDAAVARAAALQARVRARHGFEPYAAAIRARLTAAAP